MGILYDKIIIIESNTAQLTFIIKDERNNGQEEFESFTHALSTNTTIVKIKICMISF